MEFLINNWFIIVTLVALCAFVGIAFWKFCKLPNDEQLNAVREWLLGAVTQAERELGNGTGRLKLRYVYDLFVTRFPWLAKVIPFSAFSDLVDDALEEMREMLAQNVAVKEYVEGETVEERKVGF